MTTAVASPSKVAVLTNLTDCQFGEAAGFSRPDILECQDIHEAGSKKHTYTSEDFAAVLSGIPEKDLATYKADIFAKLAEIGIHEFAHSQDPKEFARIREKIILPEARRQLEKQISEKKPFYDTVFCDRFALSREEWAIMLETVALPKLRNSLIVAGETSHLPTAVEAFATAKNILTNACSHPVLTYDFTVQLLSPLVEERFKKPLDAARAPPTD